MNESYYDFAVYDLDNREEISQNLFKKSQQELSYDEYKKIDQYIIDHKTPQWKRIPFNGIPSYYMISNTGKVINGKTNKELKPQLSKKGYLLVGIFNRNHYIHRLVAQMFIPNPENKPQVNHINGDKFCNWIGNLEWSTARENIQHAIDHKLFYVGLGQNANAAIYTDDQIHRVCQLLECQRFHNKDIAQMTGVDPYTVSKVKCKEGWIHISNQYNIPKPVQNAIGSAAAASKYNDQQIHKVCKLLKEKTPMVAIEKLTGVGYDMIYRIKKGKNWTHIAKEYGIISE